MEENSFCPLKNERVIVRRLLKEGKITNPKHVLYGGMALGAFHTFTVPMLRNGQLVDVLTKQEKDYLEEVMGLETNALSVHRKVDNFWSNYQVKLGKEDTYLDLSIPEDYIKYKVVSVDVLTDQIDRLIQSNANLFLTIAQDPLLDTKVLLKKGIEFGAVKIKNDLFYDSDGRPLCDAGNATFSVAAEWLNKPKNQGVKLAIEAKIKSAEESE